MDPERDLVERLRARDPRALEEAWRELGARVHRLCRRMLGRPADAEDATQEVFLKLYERAGSFEGRARLATWVYRLTVRHCLHRIERERLRSAAALPDELVDRASEVCPVERSSRAESRERLERLLARLSPEHRAVLLLREVEELSYQEIAAALAVPVGTVMSRLSRAREALARLARPPEEGRRARPALARRDVPKYPEDGR